MSDKWIRCSERMPMLGLPVIVWRTTPTMQYVRPQEAMLKLRSNKYIWRIKDKWVSQDFVSHWQPFPGPPV